MRLHFNANANYLFMTLKPSNTGIPWTNGAKYLGLVVFIFNKFLKLSIALAMK